jgi:uncharacterized protein (DUF934 family)
MPLVKAGRVVEDRFVRVLDDAPVPEDVPVILPAARLLADAPDLVLRAAPVGVIWPNDRPIAELAPYLDWLAIVALVFPNFRDGRAYSQARLLRERHRFRGELRATGQVLRDQFLFMLRAGFDAFEVTKEADVAAFAGAIERYSVFYQPTGDGRAVTRDVRASRLAVSGAEQRREWGRAPEPQPRRAPSALAEEGWGDGLLLDA